MTNNSLVKNSLIILVVFFNFVDTIICQVEVDPFVVDSTFRVGFESYSPYHWLSYEYIPTFVTNSHNDCSKKIEYSYLYDGKKQPATKLILVLNNCSPERSTYKLIDANHDYLFTNMSPYSGYLVLMDTINFEFEDEKYSIEKYKIMISDDAFVTLYYNAEFGMIKQYASYRSIRSDNIELVYSPIRNSKRIIPKALINAIKDNNSFHERYDLGPRIIDKVILDKKCFRKTRRKYKRLGYL